MTSGIMQNLVGIAIGIRFRPNFSVEDRVGSIVDSILYSENSFFNPKLFSKVEIIPKGRSLINDETGDVLTITNSDVILQLTISDSIKITDIQEINHHFEESIIQDVLRKNNIVQINRVGYIHNYLFKNKKFAHSVVNKLTGIFLPDVNDFKIRFSKKMPLPESLSQQKVNNYSNAIYNIVKKPDTDEIFFSLDFQRYFDPLLSHIKDLPFSKFIESVNSYNLSVFAKWLNDNFGEMDQ